MKEITRRGHEIACHSYWHRRVDRLSPEQFREDTLLAISSIEKATGRRPRGYRAPSWSISDATPWAFDILAELGFDYDSSIFPIKHDLYGVPHGPRKPIRITTSSGRTLQEIPASTVRLFGQNLPVTGGGYFRHAPLWYSRALIRHLNKLNLPANVYLHPWEFDPNPPQVSDISLLSRIRGGAGTDILQMKLDRLLTEGEFITLAEYTQELVRTTIGFERRTKTVPE
jgi:polysaccharide deacetylase family protein (PEP-CTERM system associated)